MMLLFSLGFISLLLFAIAYKNPHYVGNRTSMVHLFEWKFSDIAKECEDFLGPMGYGGVQVSPISENLVINGRPWFERYQPISYKIISRSGTKSEFSNMVQRCSKAGVRIYVDAVINHMTANAQPAYGVGHTPAQPNKLLYPAVPYSSNDFNHPTCTVQNYNNATEVRNCELSGLHDLNQSNLHVRDRIVQFLNTLIDLGVAGIRIDAAKHMWPNDLNAIYHKIKKLSSKNGFPQDAECYIYQEVIDLGGEAVKKFEYTDFANVIDFSYGIILGKMFRGQDSLSRLQTFNDTNTWNLTSSDNALIMIDNHDNQRGHGAGGATILTHKDPKPYKMAVAFMLAHPYGHPRIMSSYAFTDPNQGPPADPYDSIISPKIINDECVNGWVCEHRWPQIYHMVRFRNLVKGEKIQNWWSNGKNQIAFSRGAKGFVAFNVEGTNLQKRLQTGLPEGTYCDIITGEAIYGHSKCSGKSVQVGNDSTALIEILSNATEGVLALHIQTKLKTYVQ
ncbi:PREDICTED: alpha-amylase 1-like [Trachymyrmex septentrionalis]|uniref:alpha-amylase 1-like n=1 Tax=Trachymyrmex septentrionalis TaxID=34720 RepID=UPI00084F283B|nr:PREDICTED: alpha-amylase 1-like [Trachymyrmex septentrionalis]